MFNFLNADKFFRNREEQWDIPPSLLIWCAENPKHDCGVNVCAQHFTAVLNVCTELAGTSRSCPN